MTEPQGRPPLDVTDLFGWKAKSSDGRPVGMLVDREDAFCRACDAEMVGSRSRPHVSMIYIETPAPGPYARRMNLRNL